MIIAVPKIAAIWLFIKVEISSPIPVAMMIYSSAAGERQETAFMRYAKHKHRQAAEQEKFSIPSAMYGSCLPSKIRYGWWESRKG